MESIKIVTADGQTATYYFKELEPGQTLRIKVKDTSKKKRGRRTKPEVVVVRPTAPMFSAPAPTPRPSAPVLVSGG